MELFRLSAVSFADLEGLKDLRGLKQKDAAAIRAKITMKQLSAIIISLLLWSCAEKKENPASEQKDPVALGKELFEGTGNCFACHKEDQKIIGPSIVEIARIYREQNADMDDFLKGNGKPIVDPSQYEVMKTNFTITKAMSEEELKALEAYVMSFLN